MKFTKHDAVKLKRVGMSWRKPRGRKNKTKVGKKGHRPMPSKGYMTDSRKRYRIAGKMPVRVHTPADIDSLTSDNIIIIAGSVGALKRTEIINVANSKNIRVINHERNAKDAEKTGQ